ncbi:MAG: hypothetical protein ACERKN_21465 [Velocimicrobium sp.]
MNDYNVIGGFLCMVVSIVYFLAGAVLVIQKEKAAFLVCDVSDKHLETNQIGKETQISKKMGQHLFVWTSIFAVATVLSYYVSFWFSILAAMIWVVLFWLTIERKNYLK